MAPRRCAPGPGQAGEIGQRVEREVHLARRSAEPVAPHARRRNSAGSSRAPTNWRNVRRGSTLDSTTSASSSSPVASVTPTARPCLTRMPATGASVRISAPASRAAPAIACEMAPVPPLRKTPRAKRPVDLAHVVMEQHVGGAGRPHAQERADDARRGHRRLQDVGLEPLIEEVGRAHRHELEVDSGGRRRTARGTGWR